MPETELVANEAITSAPEHAIAVAPIIVVVGVGGRSPYSEADPRSTPPTVVVPVMSTVPVSVVTMPKVAAVPSASFCCSSEGNCSQHGDYGHASVADRFHRMTPTNFRRSDEKQATQA